MMDVWQMIVEGKIGHYTLSNDSKKGNVMIGGMTYCYNITEDTITISKSVKRQSQKEG